MWGSDGTWVRTRQDDQRIALALASHVSSIGVVYLARDAGALSALRRKVADLGGRVAKVDSRIGYMRATLPISAAREALDVGPGDVAAIDLDLSFFDGGARAAALAQRPAPPKGEQRLMREIASSKWILRAPSPILHDLGADAWRREHPTYDGRGVNIADVELLVDPQIPELSGALALDGKPVRKIAGLHLTTDPGDHTAPGTDWSKQWVNMRAVVNGRRSVEYMGHTYQLPYAGRFRIGIFDLLAVVQETYWINPVVFGATIGDGKFAVLWDAANGRVWVDTTRTRDFRRDRAMRDYNVSGDWSTFGSSHSSRYPMLHPTVSFVVLPDTGRQAVAIALGAGTHAVGVATTAAGSPTGPDDPVHGVAPAAQIDSFEYGNGSSIHSQAEALIAAFEDPKVDLVCYEFSGLLVNSDEEGWFIDALAERLVRRFDKPLFVPGNNEPALAAIADEGLGSDVISVGASESAASYALYEGFRPATNDHKHWGGLSDGPGQDGSLKPDILAPSGLIAAVQSFFWDPFSQRRRGYYTLPAGLWRFGGTSQATPVATGAAALLLSAARQAELHVDATSVATALLLGARHSNNLTANDQGNGLIDVAASWRILVAESRHPGSFVQWLAPVCGGSVRTAQWPNGAPNGGRGIFETIGWHPGDRGIRSMRFCLASPAPVGLHASILLDDGTFRIAGVKGSGSAAIVSVAIDPIHAGFHSALVQLSDNGGRVVGRGMVGIAAAVPLNAGDGYSTTQHLMVPRPGWTTTWVDVPPGTDALTVDVDRHLPVGVGLQDPSGIVRRDSFRISGTHTTLTIPSPMAGDWEVLLLDIHDIWDHTRALLPVEPAVATVKIEAVRADRSGSQERSVYASVPIHQVGSVRSLVSQSGRLTSEAPVLISVAVPAHSDALFIDLSGSDPRVDAYFLDCVHPRCSMVAQVWGSEPDKRTTLGALPPGHYVLALDDYDVGQHGTALPSYRASIVTYNHQGSDTSGGRAYEVEHHGLFIVTP